MVGWPAVGATSGLDFSLAICKGEMGLGSGYYGPVCPNEWKTLQKKHIHFEALTLLDFRGKVCNSFLSSLCWNLKFYCQGNLCLEKMIANNTNSVLQIPSCYLLWRQALGQLGWNHEAKHGQRSLMTRNIFCSSVGHTLQTYSSKQLSSLKTEICICFLIVVTKCPEKGTSETKV